MLGAGSVLRRCKYVLIRRFVDCQLRWEMVPAVRGLFAGIAGFLSEGYENRRSCLMGVPVCVLQLSERAFLWTY